MCGAPAWLVAQPASLGVSQPHMDGKDLRVDVAITGKLMVVLGDKPATTAAPLPKLQPVTEPPGFAVHAQLRVATASLAEELNKRLKDKHLGGRGPAAIVVTQVKIIDEFDARHPRRIRVAISVSGPLQADLKLQGELDYDEKKHQLALKDFDYTLDTDNQALQSLSAEHYAALRKLVADNAHWKLDTRAAGLGKAVTAALGGVWREHLKVSGELRNIQLESFTMEKGILVAEVVLSGALDIAFTP